MRGLLHRLPFGAAILALVLAGLAPAPAVSETVRIGARVDARPFIWKDAGTGNYLGFLWDICTEAVQRAGYTVDPRKVEVGAETRTAFLSKGVGNFDLLCDPTTITLERMMNFTPQEMPQELPEKALGLAFTQIVFVANASYVVNPAGRRTLSGDEAKSRQNCETMIASMENGNDVELSAPEEPALPEKTDPWMARVWSKWLAWMKSEISLRPERLMKRQPERSVQLWGYIHGSTSQRVAEKQLAAEKEAAEKDPAHPITCLYPLESHEQAAGLYCNGRLNRYYGDIDIIRATIADYGALNGGICKTRQREGPETEITYEPYAFAVSSSNFPDLPEQITLALYSMFGDGTVERLFAGHFPNEVKSEPLAELFRLNSIPLGIREEPVENASAPGPK